MSKMKGFLYENNDNKNKLLGEIIKDRRETFNLSQREVARKINIDNSGLAKIERSERKKPSVIILKKLSFILAIDLDFLMRKAGYEQSEIDLATSQTFMYMEDSGLLLDDLIENEKNKLNDLIEEKNILKKIINGDIILTITYIDETDKFDFDKFIKNQLKEKEQLIQEQNKKINGMRNILNNKK